MWWRRHASKVAIGLIGFFAGVWGVGVGAVPLFDWDEVNFAECTREMRVSGIYLYPQIGFLPFWEKPPLFFWVQAVFMEVFGENAWGARLPNVFISALTLGVLYYLGKRWHGEVFGLVWLFLQGVSLLPSFYARSGLIDPLFNLFMLLATVCGAHTVAKRHLGWAMGMGLFAGLATLTKGPVGLLMPALAVGTVLLLRRRLAVLGKLVLGGGLAFIAVIGPWLALLLKSDGGKLLKDFWAYQWRLFSTPDAGHGGPWYYHLVVVGVGLFPASLWAIGAWRLPFRKLPVPAQALLWLTAWTLVVFSLVKTKILHYSSLSYYGVSYLAAWVWLYHRKWIWTVGGGLTGLMGLLFALGTLCAGLFMHLWPKWIGQVNDPFVQAAIQNTPLDWKGTEGWPGFVLAGGLAALYLLPWRNTGRLGLLGLVCLLWEALLLRQFAARVETYTQGPLRQFCTEKAQEGALVWPVGFKSYIPFFYGQMSPDASPAVVGDKDLFQQKLLAGEMPFPVYFVSRVDRYKPFQEVHRLEVVEQRGGYVLLALPYRGPGRACK